MVKTDSNPSHPVIVGKVAGVFGIKGWVKIRSETEPLTNILQYSPWYLKINKHWQRFDIVKGQPHGKGLIVQLEDCTDRDRAAELVGSLIGVEPEQLPALDENEYYWSDLIGLEVDNLQGQVLGTITSLMQTGANDVLVIEKQDTQILIPYVQQHYVIDIDLSQGKMQVDWPWLDDANDTPDTSAKDGPDDEAITANITTPRKDE